ncbi:tRNA (adenosine(37)-N6)-threonylcarbamoyltransferase complex dimerization subunit type 1 TsaB [Aestuariicella hydrocarbonica]|uniref:tRNA threonylcarbamoyladenosine biosynthesis protein TsaB n=1 Tax=Pseudomaricurvus hydrocarbonicus TaxID=1470433 RepID=A0A9E5MMN7_9GAMM|nr:tRNA (adenosine(37)-N6)-threonylcarbamoyltransferase complex dimerization subunit type 1 TsaB [Aestuariicella hydrocarbonica]NHO67059.1 tRNA (adenosine(37)-N6)-threonylcarbamoyltransferase complex dimerization subunit type 1 TsaB [Aestuariicella hydrocarbonica]
MNTILAVDTSCDACSIALLKDGIAHAEFIQAPREHTQRLLPMIDALLQNHSMTVSDLDAIAYGRGPGSFTGLRICLSVVQGLGFASDTPLIPVSTLQTMAVGAAVTHDLEEGGHILVALDARMEEVYWALFQFEAGNVNPVSDEFVCSPNDVLSFPLLSEIDKQALIKVGAGCHYPAISKIPAQLEDQNLLPRAENMLHLAEMAISQGKVVKAEDAQPVYLRDSVAWKKRQRIRS